MSLPMYTLLVCGLLTVMPLGTLVGAKSIPSGSREEVTRGHLAKRYALKDRYQGNDFFSQWYFFTGSDPTNGNVNYLSGDGARNQGLAYVNQADGTFVLAVDSWSYVPVGGKRNSVRIQSQKSYTGGLFILDAVAMPTGCGTWPSFWTNGPNWPLSGEIDIVEGINNQPNNQMTLHSGTSNPCTINTNSKGTFTGHVLSANCYSTQNADSGCSIADADTRSFGYGFNAVQGGVFAFLWDTSAGMSLWHFARSDIPNDIINQAPNPGNWGTPAGFWSVDTCDIADNFHDHTMIIDTTICGGWAGGAYANSHCPGTCSEIVANATNFANAKWVIKSVAVYQ